jgi:hypothetical protein
MNVIPGSAFFQTVQGSAAMSGASSSSGGTVQSVQAPSPESSATDRQRAASPDIQAAQRPRPGPPGTNLDIIV